MLIMGMNYKKDCPKEPRIVYYLIIGGLTGLIETVLLLTVRTRIPIKLKFNSRGYKLPPMRNKELVN
ncbi:hypothetical protein M8J75_005831 [Diaphorina citri]|nr:hypothetical protein M8J75_005831 [Diaphorina citri]